MKAFRALLANLWLGRRPGSSNLFNPSALRDEPMLELGVTPRTSREPAVNDVLEQNQSRHISELRGEVSWHRRTSRRQRHGATLFG
jgi:hypothetical protein